MATSGSSQQQLVHGIHNTHLNRILVGQLQQNTVKIFTSFVCPADVGRIPSKLASRFSDMTAEQWLSLYTLKDVVSWRDYKCWHLFVKICCLLCQMTVTEANLHESEALLKQIWKAFVNLYGKEVNMHLHGHLTDILVRFSYIMINGILGSYQTNNPMQYMRRLLDVKAYAPINCHKSSLMTRHTMLSLRM